MTHDEIMVAVRHVLTECLGESVHTALRKCDAVQDGKVWQAIRDMPPDQWSAAMDVAAEWLADYIEHELGEAES